MTTDSFVLMRDISPLVPGHCLLVSRRHCSSFARLNDREIEEFQIFKHRCVEYVKYHFSAPLLFEHGASGDETRSGACVVHAHIHFLPVCAPMEDWLSDIGPVRHFESVFPLPPAIRDGVEDYLACEDQAGHGSLVTLFDRDVPCQFVRRRVADLLKLPEWNWKSVFRRLAFEPLNTAS